MRYDQALRLPPKDWQFANFEQTFGILLRDMRKGQKLTQRELAQKAEVSGGYIAQLEMSNTYPSIEMAEKLGEILQDVEGILVQQAELERYRSISFESFFDSIGSLLKDTYFLMNDDERQQTFARIEQRINAFQEPRAYLADNFRRVWLGKLGLDEEPKNGLRPLRHYIAPWSEDIEDWGNIRKGTLEL